MSGARHLLRRLAVAPLCALLLLAACKAELNAGLNERAANEEVALLLRHGIPAARTRDAKTDTLTVFVEQSRFADAVDLLRDHGLPRPQYASIADVFKGDGLVVSPVAERARLVYAQDEELSHTISQIDGVLSARVHVVTQGDDPLVANPPPTASVFVRYAPGSPAPQLVPQIKQVVAAGVSGLAYDRVSVVMVAAAGPTDAPVAAPQMAELFGIWVDAGDAQTVQIAVAAATTLTLGLLLLVLWLGLRLWGARAERRAAAPGRAVAVR